MPKKRRGAPNLYPKTAVKMGESLTPKGLHFLSTLAEKAGLSPSELCEAMATGRIALYSDSAEIKLAINAAADEAAKGSALHEATTELQPNNQGAEQKDQSLSSGKDESSQKQLEEQAHIIADLKQQITQLQGQLESQVVLQASQKSSNESLKQQFQEQATELATLRQQIAQLRSLAAVGETRLNKWQSRNFSR